ncbi:GntR family transcriptional regulator [Zhihengliuella sp.]|uniref:GntR family transcriptional regulator n=1 Tax=Zhihengliuella sp. TaxID=1954483 RepID=UPI002810E25F|nr:GntR family transcriptional regulator [Zhihengliuella sp.]
MERTLGAARDESDGRTVARQSYRQQAIDIIRAQIVSGLLAPGELHSIGSIAERLGVSITPVREAVHDLAKEGLLEMRRNRGFLVRTLSEDELDEIVHVRTLLEVPAVREIAERRLVESFEDLRRRARETQTHAEAGQWEQFLRADRDFHLSLLAALGNGKLVEIVGNLRDQSRLFGLDKVAGTSHFLDSTREHTELLDVIEAGEASRAAEIMTAHLRHIRGIWAGQPER